ncbi:MAG TPA: response regulator transcription factor [Gaiellaceae bacterium]|jgi:DNA-binding NarL/FixJ family response regulator
MAIKVLLADDHRLILAGIRRALEEVEDLEVVGEAESGSQVLPLIHQTSPDLVLLDLRLPDMSGLACLDAIRQRYPEVKVVILSAFSDTEHIQAAFQRGATAYIVKSVNPVDLPSALRQALDQTVYQGVRVIGDMGGQAGDSLGLTEREMSMLKALARGLSNQAISKEFWVTEQTVKFHLSNIYRKLGVANRTEAARFAYERGLVESAA